jgi:hypothetical protein
VLFTAGWKDAVTILDQVEREKQDPHLWAVSSADGKTLAEYELDGLPVFDGIVAARNRLFVSLQNGKVVCFGKEKE